MNASADVAIAGRWDAARVIRDGGIFVGIMILVLLLPPLIYGLLVWRQFDFVSPSGYIPYEEARQALAGGDLPAFLGTPLLSMNMTSGALLSSMYSLMFGQ